MDKGTWQATVYGVTKRLTLSVLPNLPAKVFAPQKPPIDTVFLEVLSVTNKH